MKKYYGLGMLLAVATTLFGGCEQKVIEDSVALDVQAQESEQVVEKLVNSLGEEVSEIKTTYYDSNLFTYLESDDLFFENRISKDSVSIAKSIFKVDTDETATNNSDNQEIVDSNTSENTPMEQESSNNNGLSSSNGGSTTQKPSNNNGSNSSNGGSTTQKPSNNNGSSSSNGGSTTQKPSNNNGSNSSNGGSTTQKPSNNNGSSSSNGGSTTQKPSNNNGSNSSNGGSTTQKPSNNNGSSSSNSGSTTQKPSNPTPPVVEPPKPQEPQPQPPVEDSKPQRPVDILDWNYIKSTLIAKGESLGMRYEPRATLEDGYESPWQSSYMPVSNEDVIGYIGTKMERCANSGQTWFSLEMVVQADGNVLIYLIR